MSAPLPTSPQSIRLLIVDDQEVVRAGLRSVFEQTNHITVVGEADGGEEALAKVRELSPDILLVDLSMPRKMGGDQLICEIERLGGRPWTLVLSNYDAPERIQAVRRAGARGYVSKNAPIAEIVQAVERVMRGETFPPCSPRGLRGLSTVEKEVAILVAKEFTNAEIARLRGTKTSTIDTQVASIFGKWEVTSRMEVANIVRDLGWLEEGQRVLAGAARNN